MNTAPGSGIAQNAIPNVNRIAHVAATQKDVRFLDSVTGTWDDAWKVALQYGELLREHSKKELTISVKHRRGRLFYLYVEGEDS